MTKYVNKFLTPALVTMVILTCFGCSGNGEMGGRIGEQHEYRFISIRAYGLKWPVPMEVVPDLFPGDIVGYAMHISGNEEDKGIPFSDLVSKVEVDPGDGSGWLDFTQGYLDALPNRQIGTHSFDESGNYEYLLRVTYWDGEVFVDDGFGQGIVTILPAPDDAQ